ncbi:antiterminator LoaP [Marispirochaeta sp.]|jgi:transcription termination/antitermination protein NusG|uniref:antiterminator LoaP n=1 Tax=Marispirochaeta sp. TaxID=2038653 RepID=UPI0029C6F452|nr:antiterminator LoaP [Marispirochaeta sp.]
MEYFVLQVQTRGEARILKLARAGMRIAGLDEENYGRLIFPQRTLTIRRRGKTRTETAAIYPGYIFIEAEKLEPELYWALRPIQGIYKFLKSNTNIEPLHGEDRRTLLHFLEHGETVAASRVVFDENNRILVKEGPLKGLEGRIVKVDKRKRRAKVRLSVYENSFMVDFGFELIQTAAENEKEEK